MKLYFVVFTDGAENFDFFVTASSPFEAFVLWRDDNIPGTPAQLDAHEVAVFPVPRRRAQPQVHGWDHAGSTVFKLNDDSLAAEAVLATYRERARAALAVNTGVTTNVCTTDEAV